MRGLIERLRAENSGLADEAADEIERLYEALTEIRKTCEDYHTFSLADDVLRTRW